MPLKGSCLGIGDLVGRYFSFSKLAKHAFRPSLVFILLSVFPSFRCVHRSKFTDSRMYIFCFWLTLFCKPLTYDFMVNIIGQNPFMPTWMYLNNRRLNRIKVKTLVIRRIRTRCARFLVSFKLFLVNILKSCWFLTLNPTWMYQINRRLNEIKVTTLVMLDFE